LLLASNDIQEGCVVIYTNLQNVDN